MNTMRKFKNIVALFLVALVLSSCSLPGLGGDAGKDAITVTGGVTTETQILAGIVKGMIEHYIDQPVQVINNLGSTTINHQAMINGDANISAARYTGTDLTSTLQMTAEKDPKKAMDIVVKEFEERYKQKYYPSYGFANTYAFMVTKETAEKYQLKKISDFKKVADQLNAGVDSSWLEKEGDGYRAFKEDYGFDFKRVYPMQIGLVYDALAAGKMDAVLGYSTDGRIASYDLVVLEDDLKFFPPYDASPVATDAILKAYPKLNGILEKLEGKIDTKTMQQLNYKADNDLIEPEVVAQDFLKEHDYFSKGDN